MAKTVKVALVGIVGYGKGYLDHLMDQAEGKDIDFVAAIARRPERCERIDEIRHRGIRVCESLGDFYNSGGKADIVMISSPIQVHCQQACLAMENGSHVLCEKPIAATVQEAFKIMETEERTGRFAAIGYQWSFSNAVQAVKKDIMAGVYGRPVQMKTLVCWPRDEKYYSRNDWAGGLKTEHGDWILDSPINNATAHFLHNMFYVMGATRETSAMPVDVQAELYRANPIQNFDTGALRCHMDNGSEVLFYSTHASPKRIGPVIHYRYDRGDVYFENNVLHESQWVGRTREGKVRLYGSPEHDKYRKIWDCIEAVRDGVRPVCCAHAATPHILCVNGLQESMPDIVEFPKDMVKVVGSAGSLQNAVNGLDEYMIQCMEQSILFSEHGNISWAKPGRRIDLRNYKCFPQDSLA